MTTYTTGNAMARGKRQPFDTAHYETLKAQGLNQRAIAEQMGLPRPHYKTM
jgi:hypothetical protein